MSDTLVIAAAQPLLTSFDVDGNVTAHAEAVRAAEARVVVFPEMSSTGYEFAAPPVAPDDPRLAPLVSACAEAGAVALIGAPLAATAVPDAAASGGSGGGSGFGPRQIAMLAVDGTGARVVYRKQYLGAAEAACFTPGPAPAVLDVDGWRLGLAICKDTGIVQHAADTAALGMDVYVAGLLEGAEDAEVAAERARRVAADHGVPVVIASFAGGTGEGYDRAAGGSGIWAADGSVLGRAGTEPGEIVCATLRR